MSQTARLAGLVKSTRAQSSTQGATMYNLVMLLMSSFMTLVMTSKSASATDSCPRLQGTFHCRSATPFDLSINQELQNGNIVYKIADPTGVKDVIADGQLHEMNFRNGKGQYRARCERDSVLVEAHAPTGEILLDRYYIERSALVRIRLSGANQAPSSLSCAPTQGTWTLYPH